MSLPYYNGQSPDLQNTCNNQEPTSYYPNPGIGRNDRDGMYGLPMNDDDLVDQNNSQWW